MVSPSMKKRNEKQKFAETWHLCYTRYTLRIAATRHTHIFVHDTPFGTFEMEIEIVNRRTISIFNAAHSHLAEFIKINKFSHLVKYTPIRRHTAHSTAYIYIALTYRSYILAEMKWSAIGVSSSSSFFFFVGCVSVCRRSLHSCIYTRCPSPTILPMIAATHCEIQSLCELYTFTHTHTHTPKPKPPHIGTRAHSVHINTFALNGQKAT